MKAFYVHDADGRILRQGVCQDLDLEHQAGEGEIVVEGEADFRKHYVGEKGELVDIPEQPSPTHEFDWKAKTWLPNDELAWEEVRAERLRLLRESDWTDLVSAEKRLAPEELKAWQDYRQDLRDITVQPDPLVIAWPAAPDAAAPVVVDPVPVVPNAG